MPNRLIGLAPSEAQEFEKLCHAGGKVIAAVECGNSCLGENLRVGFGGFAGSLSESKSKREDIQLHDLVSE
jgi:hypothetical protein